MTEPARSGCGGWRCSPTPPWPNCPIFAKTHGSLLAAGLDVITYTDVHVEPTDASFQEAARFAQESNPDGYVSLGGGSVIDTCKAANLYATYPADFLAYVNKPIGEGKPVPGPLKPHIACPTTAGTGSEVTGITIFDLLSLKAKTGIASHALRPTEALVDPDCTASLPPEVVASAGLDVLSHALESYTARPYVLRSAPERPSLRPMSQGANPWSDLGCREALRLLGKYLERAVSDAADTEAREQMMWAATLAGIAFGNAGVHAPTAWPTRSRGWYENFAPLATRPMSRWCRTGWPSSSTHLRRFVSPRRRVPNGTWRAHDCSAPTRTRRCERRGRGACRRTHPHHARGRHAERAERSGLQRRRRGGPDGGGAPTAAPVAERAARDDQTGSGGTVSASPALLVANPRQESIDELITVGYGRRVADRLVAGKGASAMAGLRVGVMNNTINSRYGPKPPGAS